MDYLLKNTTGGVPLLPQEGVSGEHHLEITRGKPPDEWDALLIGGGASEDLNEKDLDTFFNNLSSLDSPVQTETIAPSQGL